MGYQRNDFAVKASFPWLTCSFSPGDAFYHVMVQQDGPYQVLNR
jgi:hypothetical protein